MLWDAISNTQKRASLDNETLKSVLKKRSALFFNQVFDILLLNNCSTIKLFLKLGIVNIYDMSIKKKIQWKNGVTVLVYASAGS